MGGLEGAFRWEYEGSSACVPGETVHHDAVWRRSDRLISTMDDLRLRLADMGEQILDDTYTDLLLNSFPKEFTFIRQMHRRGRSFTLEQIK